MPLDDTLSVQWLMERVSTPQSTAGGVVVKDGNTDASSMATRGDLG